MSLHVFGATSPSVYAVASVRSAGGIVRAVEAALTLKTAVFLSSGGDLVRYPCFIVPGTRNRFSICSYIFFFGALSISLSLSSIPPAHNHYMMMWTTALFPPS